jgi:hypothetical protein
MDPQRVARRQLLALIEGGKAHMGFEDAVSGFPLKEINRRLPNATYTVWHLLEHARIAQWDILRFTTDPNHVSPDFPEGYWPAVDKIATPREWKKTIRDFLKDLRSGRQLVKNPKIDLFAPIPHAKDCTVFQEILLLADHNAYHLGELVSLRRVLSLKPIREY